MPKRSIFIKIYLCFLFASLLVIAAQISLDRLIMPPFPVEPPLHPAEPPVAGHLKHTLGPVLTVYGHRALEYHVLGDRVALKNATEQLKRLTNIDAYLIDGTNRDVSNRLLSREVMSIALLARQTGKIELSSLKRRVLLALPIEGEDGNRYCVVGDILPANFDSFSPPHPGSPQPPGLPPPPPFGPPPLSPPFLLSPGPTPFPSTLLLLFRLFITLIISGGVCYWFARYLTSPVIKLRDATRRFADGELTVRIGKSAGQWKDELSELANDFDSMAERIASLLTQQRQLIRDISHELRSPLARLAIAVELVRRQTGEEAAPALDRMEKEAMLLNEMIGQVLAIARFENDLETVRMIPIDLTELLEEIIDDANFEAHARNCAVQLLESTACTVMGNEGWLRRAIENVVRNAVRYTHDNTTVDISLIRTARDAKPYAELSIRDYGPGVPETSLPYLFRPFYRVSNARERQTGGTGLGLAITERAITVHHGFITVSNAPDGGLIVKIVLPI
jgi:signal transduction histidine kinase